MQTVSRQALIVDPEAPWRDRLCGALSAAGFRCDAAADGMQASELIERKSYDLLVTELVIPKVHGHALVVRTLQQTPRPQIVVLTTLSDARLVRDLLSRGVADFLHKTTPEELLTTKLLSLFDLDQWRASREDSTSGAATAPQETLLLRVEKRLVAVSDHFADQLGPLFENEFQIAEVPRGVIDFVDRLCIDERAVGKAELHAAANTRRSERVEVRTTAVLIQVDEHLRAKDAPVQVVLLDVSTTGVRLLHTRALPATDLVLSWQAVTLPFHTFRLPVSVTRCRPVGRFYDIGGMFDIPPGIEFPE